MKHKLSADGFLYRLRPVKLTDARFIIDTRLEDSERNKYIHKISDDEDAQRAWLNEYFDRDGDYYFVIENRLTGSAEGLIGFYDEKDGCAEWGRWVIKKNSFAAVESINLLYGIAFEQLGLSELYCRTLRANEEVVSFHSSIGEKTRSILEGHFELNGERYDAVEQYADRDTYYKDIKPLLDRRSMMIFKRAFKQTVGDLEFHHIGVATKDIDKEYACFSLLGYAKEGEPFEDENQGVRGQFIVAKGQPRLELLSNLDGCGTLDGFIESGNKMYHFGYMTSKIEKAYEAFLNCKCRVLSPMKESVYFGKRICFLVMQNRYIIELIEK